MVADTRSRLLQEAEKLIRTRGYSAFSYADLSSSVEITKASVHYHFPTKEDLAVAMLEDYIARLVDRLAGIRRDFARAGERLHAYARLFLDGFEQGMLPLCGALSAERSALPEGMRAEVSDFFRMQLDWLADVLREGQEAGEISRATSPEQSAMLLMSTLEGGCFVGWALQQVPPVLAAFEMALAGMEAPRGQRNTTGAQPP